MLATSLIERLAPRQQITVPQARLYAHAIRLSWRAAGLPSWTKDQEAQQFSDAERLIETARICSELEDEESSKVAYRRAADLLEWLSRSRPPQPDHAEEETIPLALLSAASYQLADLPAMARGLLLEKRLAGNTGRLFAAFLRADFAGTLRLVIDYWRDRLAQTESNGSWMPSESGERVPHDDILSSEIVRCLGLIAQSLRLDDRDRLDMSVRKLNGLSKLAARTADPYIWLTVALTSQVAVRYASSSLWRWTELLHPRVSDEGRDVLGAYVRFQYRHGRGLLWPSQQEGVRRLASGTSFAMCTPTGSGKTTIAELAILRTLYPADEGDVVPLVMYLVPSRALAAEVEARLAFDLKSNDHRITITGLYGGAEWSLTDRWLMASGPTVLVCTVEMAESLLRYVGPLLIPRLRLIVIDEAHQVQFNDDPYSWRALRSAENRAARLEQFASRIFANAPDCPAVALSAVAGGAEQAIARWVCRDESAIAVGTNYRSTRQLVGALECRADGGTRIRLELVDGRPLTLSDREDEAFVPVPFDRMPRLTGDLRSDLAKFSQCHSLWAAIQLARAGRSVLISIPQRIEATIANFCQAIFEQAAWQNPTARFFSPPGDEVERGRAQIYRDCLSACSEYCGPDSFEYQLLTLGVAVHHGALPVRVRRLMTDVIRLGIVPVAVATSTLTEGVNLPFDVIILPSIIRSQYSNNRTENHLMPVPEFLNLAGRAGRPGAGVEGMTLVALPVEPTAGPRTKSQGEQQQKIRLEMARFKELIRGVVNYTGTSATASSPLAKLLKMLWECWQRINWNDNRAAFLRWLEQTDPETFEVGTQEDEDLAATLDSLDLILVSAIEEVEQLRRSQLTGADLELNLKVLWSRTYARFAASEVDWLEQIFVTRGFGARQNVYTDPERRKRVYQLGLPPRQTTRFVALADRIEAQLRAATPYRNWGDPDRYAYIESLGTILSDDPSFRIRDARSPRGQPLTPWQSVLRWWLRAPGATPPAANHVRYWLEVATSDIEFRLGTAVSATVSAVWGRVSGEELYVPTLNQWRTQTGLPWAAFWIREMVGWGTMEPVVAFLIGENRSETREDAERYPAQYYAWYDEHYRETDADDALHPERISQWSSETFGPRISRQASVPENLNASLLRDFRKAGSEKYSVLPCELHDRIVWLDAAGYKLAESEKPNYWSERIARRHEFVLNVREHTVVCQDG